MVGGAITQIMHAACSFQHSEVALGLEQAPGWHLGSGSHEYYYYYFPLSRYAVHATPYHHDYTT